MGYFFAKVIIVIAFGGTANVTVLVTTAKFQGMNNILLARLKSSTLQKFSQLKPRT